jgi:hypothetical protein
VDPVTAFLAMMIERHGPVTMHPDDLQRLGRRIVTINPSDLVPGAVTFEVVADDTYAESLHYARQYAAAAPHPQGAQHAANALIELGARVLRLTDTERAAVLRIVGGILPPRRAPVSLKGLDPSHPAVAPAVTVATATSGIDTTEAAGDAAPPVIAITESVPKPSKKSAKATGTDAASRRTAAGVRSTPGNGSLIDTRASPPTTPPRERWPL